MITKNDNFFKLLFAIEMALLPLVICANLIMPVWAISMIIGILIVVKFLLIIENRQLKIKEKFFMVNRKRIVNVKNGQIKF